MKRRTAPARSGASAVLIVAAAVLAHLPLLSGGLIGDDLPIVQQSPVVQRGSLVEIFTTGWWEAVGGTEASLYRPVTILSFAWERALTGGSLSLPVSHAVNVLLHALAALGVAGLARRLGAPSPAPLLAGLLFAVHPVHVSAVGQLVGRADVLATGLSLAAVLLYLRTASPVPRTARAAAWGTGLLVFLALGAKEAALCLPLLLPLLDLLLHRPRAERGWWIDRAAALAPSAAATLAWLALRTSTLEAFPGLARVLVSDNPLAGLHGIERLAAALAIVPRYALLLAWPRRLSIDYSGNAVPTQGVGLLAALGLALLLGLAVLALRGAPGARFAAAWSLASYLVVSNLPWLVGVSMAERLIYLPSAGLAVLAGWGAARVPPRALRTGAALVLLALGARTFAASFDVRSDETAWEAATRAVPRSPRAWAALGEIRARQGRLEEAEAAFRTATELWPEFSGAWYQRGVLRARAGDLAGALPLFRQAALLNPWNGEAAADLGIVLHRLGQVEEAERRLRSAMRHFPDLEKPVGELADLLLATGRPAEAAALYERAVAMGRADLAPRLREARARAGARAL